MISFLFLEFVKKNLRRPWHRDVYFTEMTPTDPLGSSGSGKPRDTHPDKLSIWFRMRSQNNFPRNTNKHMGGVCFSFYFQQK